MEEQVEAIEPEPIRVASYSDDVDIRFSEFTFSIVFSQQVPPEGEKRFNSVCLGRIVMSPQHAKMFHKFLGDSIEDYEKTFNKIPLKKL